MSAFSGRLEYALLCSCIEGIQKEDWNTGIVFFDNEDMPRKLFESGTGIEYLSSIILKEGAFSRLINGRKWWKSKEKNIILAVNK